MIMRRLALLLLAFLPLVACAQTAPTTPVEGDDYMVIADGKPLQPLNGKIEVVEIFAYWCHHCANFEPLVEAWQAKLPKDVRFSYLPSAYEISDTYGRSFFAAQSLGVLGKTHAALFHAIHDEQSVPMSNASIDELAAFYQQHGVPTSKFKVAAAAPTVDAKMQQARAFVVASGMKGTPAVVIDGKYLVNGHSHEDTLRIADYLIAKERAAGAAR